MTAFNSDITTLSVHGRRRSAFGTLLLKDLCLAAPIVGSGLAILAILTAFYAVLPFLGRDVERAFLLYHAHSGVAGRIGLLTPVFVVISVLASVLSAVLIAGGDSGGRAKTLLPVLPVASWLVYASKLCATLSVLLLFGSLSGLVSSLQASGRQDPDKLAFLLSALGIGIVWAFAAPAFARSFAGVFLGTTLLPFLLCSCCAISAHWLAPVAMRSMLGAVDSDRWYRGYLTAKSGGSSSNEVLEEAVLLGAAATGLGLGLWAAWRARAVVLCRRTPRRLDPVRVARLAGMALCAMVASTAVTAVRAWTADPQIAYALETARAYRDSSAQSTAELLDSFLKMHEPPESLQPNPSRSWSPGLAWHRVYDALDGSSHDWSSGDLARRRAIREAIVERFGSDPDGLRDAALAVLADRERPGVGTRLVAARWVGPWTSLSVAVHELSVTDDEHARALLLQTVAHNAPVLGPRDASTSRAGDWGSAMFLVTRLADWGVPPFSLREFPVEKQHPSVAARAAALVTLAWLDSQTRGGTFVAQNPSSPSDRLEVDAETVRRARAAADLPLAQVAAAFHTTTARIQTGTPIEDLDDNETLYLRASELFDPASTDPSYLGRDR
jgi:hypothetical protein